MTIKLSLNSAIEKVYNPCGFEFNTLTIEKESVEYEACRFLLNDRIVIYRTAKITPKKVGQFVAIWKRNEKGVTTPFEFYDDFDFMIINCVSGSLSGQFIFPKSVLVENGVISSDFQEGKRGFRLYPSWDNTVNKQAFETQKWQEKYFLNLSEGINFNLSNAKSILNIKT